MIIAVADLHLGSQMSNKSGFSRFIREYLVPNQDDISRIILLGDILDLWRNSNSQVLQENFDVLTDLARLDMKKNYLVGNHDYVIFSLLSQSSLSIPPDPTGALDQISETLDLTSDSLKLKFVHGHQIDYWSALSFYEIFSQAMCFVDGEDEELSDVWNILHSFAEDLPEELRNKIRNLHHETQFALEEKLAGPLDGNVQGEKKGLVYEWDLLQKVSDFEDIAHMSSTPEEDIKELATEWGQMLLTLDHYPDSATIPPHLAIDVHQRRREVAGVTVGLQDDEFLIRGHGHTPYVNQETKVADAGCWLGTQGSYLKIEDGEVSVHKWK
ncbi:MAG: hypothetical protein RTU63_01695 [Candidatus Thorarchaeota archaeon]